MAEIHGSKLVVLHDGVDITEYLKDDLEFGGGDRELHDTTAFGATDDRHMVSPVKQGVPINMGGIFSTELHALLAPLDGETRTLEMRPAGTGSGLPKLAGNGTLTNYKVKTSVNAPAMWTATLTPQEGLDWGVQ